MKGILAAGLLLGMSIMPATPQQAAATRKGGSRPAAPAFVEVHPDRRVTFRLVAPKASEVKLTGEFMTGELPFAKDDKGLWSVTVGPLDPEIYSYNLVIDGVVSVDPGNPNVKSASNPNKMGSVVEVPGDKPAFYDGQMVPHGAIQMRWYTSKAIDGLRRLLIYTPPDYERNRSTRYPVLYLFHGADGDESVWTSLGKVNLMMDNLLASGKAKPFVIVMPYGYGVASGKLPRSGGGDSAARFTQDLIEDIIPFVKTEYRVYDDRGRRAIAGLSMGGDQALTIGLSHPELFSHVAAFSPAPRAANFPTTFASAIASPQETNRKYRLVWFGCGKEDDGHFRPSQSLDGFLKEHKVNHTFVETDGAHTWMVWRRYFNEVAPLLFR